MTKRLWRFAFIWFIFLFVISCANISEQNQTITRQTEIHLIYLPLFSNQVTSRLFFGVNEAYFPTIAPYYDDNYMRVALNAEWLEDSGWNYFDRKITGYDGKLFLTLSGAYSRWAEPGCLPVPRWYWGAWVDEFAILGIEHIGAERIVFAELGNEPDTSYTVASRYFGCWGETYQDGVYLAEFVNYAYVRIKAVYPDIVILSSGFMQPDTDFLNGFRSAIKYTDGISFHNYTYCNQDYTIVQDRVDWYAAEFPEWPLYFSETSLIYNTQSEACDQQQADYMRYLSEDLTGVVLIVWYTLGCNGWRNADLIYPCNPINLKPAYYEYINRR